MKLEKLIFKRPAFNKMLPEQRFNLDLGTRLEWVGNATSENVQIRSNSSYEKFRKNLP